jgi:ureidoglycolate lyase
MFIRDGDGPGPGIVLAAEPLSAAAFAPFGHVIDESGPAFSVNDGSSRRFHDLAPLHAAAGGWSGISIFRCKRAVALPLSVSWLEYHPLGSQVFVPRQAVPFVVVVAPPAPEPDLALARAFLTDGGQGVSYRPGVWHMPLAPLAPASFLVIDRIGPGENCVVRSLAPGAMTVGA